MSQRSSPGTLVAVDVVLVLLTVLDLAHVYVARAPKNNWSTVCPRQVFVCRPSARRGRYVHEVEPYAVDGEGGVCSLFPLAHREASRAVSWSHFVTRGFPAATESAVASTRPSATRSGGHLEVLLDALGFKAAAAAAVPAAPKRERRAQKVERTLYTLRVPYCPTRAVRT